MPNSTLYGGYFNNFSISLTFNVENVDYNKRWVVAIQRLLLTAAELNKKGQITIKHTLNLTS